MHHPTDRVAHTTAFVTPAVEHWLEREITPWIRYWDANVVPTNLKLEDLTTTKLLLTSVRVMLICRDAELGGRRRASFICYPSLVPRKSQTRG